MDERIRQDKARLRQTLKVLTDTLPEAYIEYSDLGIEKNLLALPQWEQARAVFIYVSTGREPETRGMIRAALNAGKIVTVPRTLADGEMEACILLSLDDLRPGRFGIPEPPADSRVLSPSHIELEVVPCIAADRQGYRLGHGGGYYDRYLQKTGCTTVCLCRERLLQTALPHDVFDIPIGIVITEDQTIRRP